MKESRLFGILYYLLDKKQATAPELAEKFEVSVRTIYRDIDSLSTAGIPIYATTGRNGGIQFHEGFVISKSFFSDKERKEILSTLQSVSVLDNFDENGILTKLSALFNIQSDNWFEVDFSRFGNESKDNTTFKLLKNAVVHLNVVKISYINSHGVKAERIIYPLKLFYKAKAWYIKSYCTDKDNFRIFKLSRIMSITLLNDKFTPMEYPVLEEDIETQCSQIKLKFSKEMAYRIYDEFEEKYVLEQADGSFIVTSCMPVDNWITSYILSFGADVEILEPTYLRKYVSDIAKNIYEKNKT